MSQTNITTYQVLVPRLYVICINNRNCKPECVMLFILLKFPLVGFSCMTVYIFYLHALVFLFLPMA